MEGDYLAKKKKSEKKLNPNQVNGVIDGAGEIVEQHIEKMKNPPVRF